MRQRIVAVIGLAFFAVGPAHAATIIVAPSSPDVLATDAVCSLREAVINANDDAATWPDCAAGSGADQIWLAAGNYVRTAPGGLYIQGVMALVGQGADQTVIDGAGVDPVIQVAAGAVVDIRSIAIIGGGGCGVSNGGELALSAVLVSGHPGSGICTGPGGDLRVEASTVSGNGFGGINTSGSWGSRGGCKQGAPVRLVNTTVSGNAFGIIDFVFLSHQCGGPVTLIGSTLTSNGLGALFGDFLTSSAGTIFTDPCSTGAVSSEGHNLDVDGSCGLTDPTDLPNTDPMLGPLQDNGGPTWTHALLPGSAAIDAIPFADCTYDDDGDPGTPEVPVAEDQRGVQRPQNTDCDIGAFEVTPCADGTNNDTDAFTDLDDPGCQDATSVREDPQCQDGINNDPGQDPDPGLIDFDGGLSIFGAGDPRITDPDPQCVGLAWKNKEKTGCGLGGFELALILPGLMWLHRRRRRLH